MDDVCFDKCWECDDPMTLEEMNPKRAKGPIEAYWVRPVCKKCEQRELDEWYGKPDPADELRPEPFVHDMPADGNV